MIPATVHQKCYGEKSGGHAEHYERFYIADVKVESTRYKAEHDTDKGEFSWQEDLSVLTLRFYKLVISNYYVPNGAL